MFATAAKCVSSTTGSHPSRDDVLSCMQQPLKGRGNTQAAAAIAVPQSMLNSLTAAVLSSSSILWGALSGRIKEW